MPAYYHQSGRTALLITIRGGGIPFLVTINRGGGLAFSLFDATFHEPSDQPEATATRADFPEMGQAPNLVHFLHLGLHTVERGVELFL